MTIREYPEFDNAHSLGDDASRDKNTHKIDLIQTAIDEWVKCELTAEEAIIRIAIVLGTSKPSHKAIEWAQNVFTS